MTNAVDRARSYFGKNHNCTQSVFRSVLEEKDLLFDEAVLLAAGFGGGIGLEGATCGVVTGGVMAIGILLGQEFNDPDEQKKQAYIISRKFLKKFRKKHESTICRDLLGVDINDPVVLQEAEKSGLFYEVCPPYIETAVQLVLKMFPD